MLVQAHGQSRSAPVRIQRAHVTLHVGLADVQLGRVADALLALVDRDQVTLLRRRAEGDIAGTVVVKGLGV